jgi:hypothetical protein
VTEPAKKLPLDYAAPERRGPGWFRILVVAGIIPGLMVIVGIVIHWLRQPM